MGGVTKNNSTDNSKELPPSNVPIWRNFITIIGEHQDYKGLDGNFLSELEDDFTKSIEAVLDNMSTHPVASKLLNIVQEKNPNLKVKIINEDPDFYRTEYNPYSNTIVINSQVVGNYGYLDIDSGKIFPMSLERSFIAELAHAADESIINHVNSLREDIEKYRSDEEKYSELGKEISNKINEYIDNNQYQDEHDALKIENLYSSGFGEPNRTTTVFSVYPVTDKNNKELFEPNEIFTYSGDKVNYRGFFNLEDLMNEDVVNLRESKKMFYETHKNIDLDTPTVQGFLKDFDKMVDSLKKLESTRAKGTGFNLTKEEIEFAKSLVDLDVKVRGLDECSSKIQPNPSENNSKTDKGF